VAAWLTGWPAELSTICWDRDDITLSGVIHPMVPVIRGSKAVLDNLSAAGAAVSPLAFVVSSVRGGQNLGQFVVVSVEFEGSHFIKDSTPRKIAFSVQLGAYGEDLYSTQVNKLRRTELGLALRRDFAPRQPPASISEISTAVLLASVPPRSVPAVIPTSGVAPVAVKPSSKAVDVVNLLFHSIGWAGAASGVQSAYTTYRRLALVRFLILHLRHTSK